MNQDLTALYAVQEVDTALMQCARQLRSLDNGAAEKEAFQQAEMAHRAAAHELKEAEATLLDAELELEAVEAKRKDHTSRLYSGRIANPKELDALQHEVEALGRRRSTLDERILLLMENVEELKQREAQLRQASEAARQAYVAKAQAYVRSARTLKDEIERLQADRANRAKSVPTALLRRYETVRATKGGVGIARIEAGHCGACKTVLPKNTVLAARESGSIVTCESCGRLLCP